MAVCSYLVFPAPGSADALWAELKNIPGCDVYPAVNNEVAVLVTDAATRDEDDALRRQVEALPDVACLALAYGELSAAEVALGDSKSDVNLTTGGLQ